MVYLQGYDTRLVKTKKVKLKVDPITNQEAAAQASFKILNGAAREHVLVFFIGNGIYAWQEVTIGGNSTCMVPIKEIFHGAILARAHSIVVVHNHPSGDLRPSKEDIDVTRQLIKAGRILGIEISDSLIIDSMKKEYVSIMYGKEGFC